MAGEISVSEKTFGQRREKGVQLSVLCQSLSVFDPVEDLIKLSTYDPFLEDILNKNKSVEDALMPYKNLIQQRFDLYYSEKGLIARGRMARDYLASLPEGKKSVYFIKVQKEVQKLVDYKNRYKPKITGLPPSGVDKKKNSTSEKGFGSMIKNGWDILVTLKEVASYNPNNELIKTDKFEICLVDIEKKNRAVEEAYIPWDKLVAERFEMYEGKEGLRVRMSKIKSYIAGEYGKQSNEYIEAVKIKY